MNNMVSKRFDSNKCRIIKIAYIRTLYGIGIRLYTYNYKYLNCPPIR